MGGSRRAPSGWEEDVSPLFPDAATRAAVTAEEPRLPSAYYEQSVPVPTGWDDDVACGHLLSVRHTKKWRLTLAAEVGLSRSLPDSTFTSSSTQKPPACGHMPRIDFLIRIYRQSNPV